MSRPLATRIAVAHQAVQSLEAAAETAWRTTRPYYLPRSLLRTTRRLDAWWKAVDAAREARTRFETILAERDVLRLNEFAAAGIPPLFSGGVPGSQKGTGARSGVDEFPPAAPFSSTLSAATSCGPLPVDGMQQPRTPDGYTGTPPAGGGDEDRKAHRPPAPGCGCVGCDLVRWNRSLAVV